MNAKPRAFEPRRLLDALREHAVLFGALLVLGLFGGAALARLWLPSTQQARAVARIVQEPHAVYRRALEDDVLERALREAAVDMPAAQLRARTRIGFAQRDQLGVTVVADDAVSPAEGVRVGRLADALVATYVAMANERVEQGSFDLRRQQDGQLERAKAERARAQSALDAALAREGVPSLTEEQHALRVRLAALEAEASAAALQASASHERLAALHETSASTAPAQRSTATGPALAEAQRALSRLLAEPGDHAREAEALRARITKLQQPPQRAPVPASAAGREAEARAQDVRARGLGQQVVQLRQALARLDQAASRVAPQQRLLEQAEARVLELAAGLPRYRTSMPRSAVLQHAEVSTHEPRVPRALVSLLLAALALLLPALFFVLRELKQLRVRAASELSHWLRVPVLSTSEWPARASALEPLVDALADPALRALGTTLLLPLTELERPLAATLVAQLNARAQRHFRSPTGSRITIAQDWQGELDSTRIGRAAEAADRVLWVVAADVHAGPSLAARRSMLPDTVRVAAVLVDAEPRAAEQPVRSVGDAHAFWRRRDTSTHEPAAPAPNTVVAGATVVSSPGRVTLH